MENVSSESQAAPVFLTLPKAARRLGVSAPIARDMARRGSLPVVHVGRRRLVVASLLNDAWFSKLASTPNGSRLHEISHFRANNQPLAGSCEQGGHR